MVEGDRLRILRRWVVNTADSLRFGSGDSSALVGTIKAIGECVAAAKFGLNTSVLSEEDIVYVNERLGAMNEPA